MASPARDGAELVMADLDRRVTLTITSEGDYDDRGIFVPGATVAHEVWARRIDARGDNVVGSDGVRWANVRTYRIRWRADAATAPLTQLGIVDGGITYTVTGLRDPAPRDRFLELDVEATT